jgi:hypothetical protein
MKQATFLSSPSGGTIDTDSPQAVDAYALRAQGSVSETLAPRETRPRVKAASFLIRYDTVVELLRHIPDPSGTALRLPATPFEEPQHEQLSEPVRIKIRQPYV